MSELFNFILDQVEPFRRARLPSLYSDFTVQRYANPDGYAANVAAWEEALRKAVRAGLIPAPGNTHDILSLRTGEDLLRSLETKEWGQPLALETVINEATSKRHMIPYQDFIDSPNSIYNQKWAPWLFSWSLQQLGLSRRASPNKTLRNARLVVVPNVEEAAGKVISRMSYKSNQVDRVQPLEIFRREAAQVINTKDGLTDSDLDVLMKFLARDKGEIAYDYEVVKFKGSGEESMVISSQDRTIASLKSLIASLKHEVGSISTRASTFGEDAQKAVLAKNRVSALAALRSRKATEATLAQRLDVLSQLEGVYDKIEQAVDQVTMVRVMEASTGVLRNLHAEAGGLTNVENVVDNLRDEMDKVNQISGAIEAAGEGDAAIDESAIADELDALVRHTQLQNEETEARRIEERLADIETPENVRDAAQLSGQGTANYSSPSTAKVAGSVDSLAVDAFDRMSLDERQVPNMDL